VTSLTNFARYDEKQVWPDPCGLQVRWLELSKTEVGRGERCQGPRPEVDPEFRASKRLITDLMSIATAVAVNSVPDLEKHLAAARESGATVEQIRSAIGIAHKIHRVGQEKIEAVTSRPEEHVSSNPKETPTTTCCGGERPPVRETQLGPPPVVVANEDRRLFAKWMKCVQLRGG